MSAQDNRVISIVIPPHLFCGDSQRSGYAKKIITRTALCDFNKSAYLSAKLHPKCDSITTSINLNAVGVRGLDAYKDEHKLTSRNQAILAILATHHAKQAVVEKVKPPSFKQAIFMIGARG